VRVKHPIAHEVAARKCREIGYNTAYSSYGTRQYITELANVSGKADLFALTEGNVHGSLVEGERAFIRAYDGDDGRGACLQICGVKRRPEEGKEERKEERREERREEKWEERKEERKKEEEYKRKEEEEFRREEEKHRVVEVECKILNVFICEERFKKL